MFPPGNTVSERWRRVGCSSVGPDFDPAILTVQTPTQNRQKHHDIIILHQNTVFVYIIYVCVLCIFIMYI